MTSRNRQCPISIPPVIFDAGVNRAGVKTEMLFPFADGLFHAVKLDKFIVSSVIILLFRCSPVAVVRRVSSVIVFALNRIAWWTFAHITKKRSKCIPLFTNGNAALAIPFVCWCTRIIAPLTHINPYIVSSRFTGCVTVDVLGVCHDTGNYSKLMALPPL